MSDQSAPKVLHAFTITGQRDDPVTQINRICPDGRVIPLYTACRLSRSTMEVRRAKGLSWKPHNGPLATVTFRSLSAKISLSLRGVPFQMARKHPFANAHRFRFLGAGHMRWEESSLFGSAVRFFDAQGRELARFRKHVAGVGPGFELYVPLADLDLDLLVTTGLAAAEYRRRSNEDWDDILDEVIGACY